LDLRGPPSTGGEVEGEKGVGRRDKGKEREGEGDKC